MTASPPWAAPTGTAVQPAVAAPPPPVQLPPAPPAGAPPLAPPQRAARPPHGRRGWVLVLIVVVLAAIASTAAITFAIARNMAPAGRSSTPSPTLTTGAPAPPAPQVSPGDAAVAKQSVCHIFDVSVRGREGQGGLRTDTGDVNLPMALRDVNSVVAVQNALTPATPPDVAAAARKYIAATLDHTTAAMGNPSTAEINRLNDIANTAADAFADACGLPH